MKIQKFPFAGIGLNGVTYRMVIGDYKFVGCWGWSPAEQGDRFRWKIWISVWDTVEWEHYTNIVFSNVPQVPILRYARQSLINSVLRDVWATPKL
jgi:hypothetical protein